MKTRVRQHVRVLPCSSVAKTKQFTDAANNQTKTTVTPNQKEPTLL